jgi:homoserine O-acetyltransferase
MPTLTISEFTLESGTTLRDVPVAYQSWGQLNNRGDNAIVVCHALTGSADAADWWGDLIGPGCALDTDRFFVVCVNVLGSPYGTASPVTTNPATGDPYGADFPEATTRDTVALHRQLLNRLGVQQAAAAIGGSMGGMHVLEWAFEQTDDGTPFVRALVPIAVGGRHSAWCIGWSEAQRQAIYADPNWNDGHYNADHPPSGGLASARMMAMISYRSRPSFEERFGRNRMTNGSPDGPFTVESYLRYQGEKLVGRFDANCYVRLTQQMDSHDVARGRGPYREVLSSITQPAFVIGIDSDVLYPLEEQRELANALPNGRLSVLSSPHGHDAFLIEQEALNNLLHPWLLVHADGAPSPPTRTRSNRRPRTSDATP